MLSCDCDYDGDGWWYEDQSDFSPLETSKRKRCRSCGELIDINALCIAFKRWRFPSTEIEEKIYGAEDAEIKMADWHICESCGEIYLNLTDLGYCYILGDDLRVMLREYHKLTGFKQKDAK